MLITLVIIGVIAAITVPTLINKTNNQEYVSKLKKAYSTLAQATNLIIAEEGPVKSWVTTTDNIYNLYRKHLNNAKECGSGTGCFAQGSYKYLKTGDSSNWNIKSSHRKLILSDGIQINFDGVYISPTCTDNHDGSSNVCTYIMVDINGQKKPNIVGRDLFLFVLKENGLYPAGCDTGNCPNTTTGYDCACKVLREGAMNY